MAPRLVRRWVVIGFCVIACPALAGTPECEMPNMLFMLDISGSMTLPPVAGGGGPSKFSIASDAIKLVQSTYGQKVSFGLDLFPWSSDCGTGVVRVPPGANTATAINDELGKTNPYGATPIAATLTALASEPSIHDPARRNFVLLLTDGSDTCSPDEIHDPVNATTALRATGVGVIVVGFGGDIDPVTLSMMARAGGYPRAGDPVYYQADSASDLSAALASIINDVTKEICDGKDNDCDGMIDEDDNGNPLSQPCTGRCGGGVMVCTNGKYDDSSCNGPPPGNACGGCGRTPREICNGIDDDCNGLVDDGAICDNPDDVCIAGRCLRRCASGECPAGKTCRDVEGQRLCVDDQDLACVGVTCNEGTTCSGGVCIDVPCIDNNTRCQGGVRQRCGGGSWTDDPCPSGWDCTNSVCVERSCYTQGCPDETVCTDGACGTPDPCAGKTCGQDEFCRDGQCVTACAFVDCGGGKTCRDGTCASDPCWGVTCPQGKTCANGACGSDPCYWVGCGYGRTCVSGACVDDPCRAITCPPGSTCYDSQCVKPGDVPATEYPDGGVVGDDSGGGAGDRGGGIGPGGDSGGGGGGGESGEGGDGAAAVGSAGSCACASVATNAPAGVAMAAVPFVLLAAAVLWLGNRRKRMGRP